MYICLKNDYPSFEAPANKGGLLTPWADRGVLMLNTCLTVRAHEANSHANRGWERFTQKVIDLVAGKRTRGVVFMAWGTPAGKRVQKVDQKRHLILKSVHPSPLSAARGYFTCRHFRLANDWLVSRYGASGEIDWALTEGTTTKKVEKPAVTESDAAKPTEHDDEDEFDDVDPDVLQELVTETKKVEATIGAKKQLAATADDEENVEPPTSEA